MVPRSETGVARRSWTLEAAREMFPEVQQRTDKVAVEVEELLATRESHPAGSDERGAVEELIESLVSRWMREMEALGVEVKGLWLVDFDNGSGCYCWKWPESELAYFHGHDEGFSGRTRIQ